MQWAQLKHYVEGELGQSAGWDLEAAQESFEASLLDEANKPNDKAPVAV